MEDNTITMPAIEYKRLISMDAKVQSLMAYVNHTKYSVDREMIGAILGLHVGAVEDGNCGE